MSFANRAVSFFHKVVFGGSPRLYGRFSSGSGAGEEIQIGDGLEIEDGVLRPSGAVIRTRAEGYPTTTERRKIVLNSGADLAGDLAGMLVYLGAETTYINPITSIYSETEYSLVSVYQRENHLGNYRYKLTIKRDGVTTGEWTSVLDSITAPLYAVGVSGDDATSNPVVKSVSVSVTEMAPSYPGQICIVGKEIFISRSETGDWTKLLTSNP